MGDARGDSVLHTTPLSTPSTWLTALVAALLLV